QATQTPPMKSSDDPGISGMPALPTPPDISKSPVGPVNEKYQSTVAKREAFGPGPNPQDYKPSMGRRFMAAMAGGAKSAALGFAGAPAMEAQAAGRQRVDEIRNRPFNLAEQTYQRNV